MGATSDEILKMKSDAVADMFFWHSVWIKENIFNPRQFDEAWSGSGIWKGFKTGDVFFSDMTQIDAFFVHGAGTVDMPGFLENPDDLGIALMPLGVSLDLNKKGEAKRVGSRNVTTGGWWWGIPKMAKNKKLAYELAHWITNTQNQIEGCSGFGMVPVRQDILSELSLMFGGGWITDIFYTASRQLVENKYTVIPKVNYFSEVGDLYIDAYYDIAVSGNVSPLTFNEIKRILKTQWSPKQKLLCNISKMSPIKKKRNSKIHEYLFCSKPESYSVDFAFNDCYKVV